MAEIKAFDTKAFRNVLGAFPTGVTVVTARDEKGNNVGVTANSFSSVSLDPALILWSIGKSSTSFDAFMAAKYWNVHFLAADQIDISNNFARSGGDKFTGMEYSAGVNGVPLIAGCMASFQCELEHQYAGGDHTILVGRVLEYACNGGQPLVFHSGRYSKLAEV